MNPVTILIFSFFATMGLLYVVVSFLENRFSPSKQLEKDRAMMETIGEDKMIYSDPYFNKLSKPSRIGENLPTRSCHNCGAAINPGEKFCPICGQDITDVKQ